MSFGYTRVAPVKMGDAVVPARVVVVTAVVVVEIDVTGGVESCVPELVGGVVFGAAGRREVF